MSFGTAKIGRLQDETLNEVPFEVGSTTVQDLLDKTSITLESNESVKDSNSNPVALDSQATDGSRYFITANVKAGRN